MNSHHSSSQERNGGHRSERDEQQQDTQPSVVDDDAHRQGRLRLTVAIAVSAISASALVIACLISLSRLKHARDQSDPGVRAARAEIVTVTPRKLYRKIKIVGDLEYGDGQIAHVTAPISGRIERVAAHAADDRVTAGEVLAIIESDPLLDGEQGLLNALAAFESSKHDQNPLGKNSKKDSLWAARKKLLLMGVLPRQLDEIALSGKVDGRLAVGSQAGGVLLETLVRAGQQVKQGDILFRIAIPDPMWFYFNVPLADLPWLSLGRSIHVSVQSTPVETFPAMVAVVSPVIDPAMHTVRAGVPLPNPEGTLKRSMPVQGTIRVDMVSDGTPEPTGLEGKFFCSTHPQIVQDSSGDCPKDGSLLVHIPSRPRRTPPTAGKTLAIPIIAVLDQHGRKLVRRLTPAGQIETVEIKVGPIVQGKNEQGEETNYYPVLAGLDVGEQILVAPNKLRNAVEASCRPHAAPCTRCPPRAAGTSRPIQLQLPPSARTVSSPSKSRR